MEDRIRSLIESSLGYREGEEIGIIYDVNYAKIARMIIDYCAGQNMHIHPIIIDYKAGMILPPRIRKLFLGEKPEVLILALRDNIWHTTERKKAKYERKKRLANILHPDAPCESYLADILQMKELGRRLEEIMKESRQMHIFSQGGGMLEASIGKTFCETGDYRLDSSGGDFPAGEVGFGPIEGTVNGAIVYDFKIQHVGFVRETPHIIEVTNDKIIFVAASEKFRKLVSRDNVLNYISEISFGINPIWTEVENEDSIVEEKNLGTVHFGHGVNLSYGNRRGPHFDAVMLKPTVYFDEELIMQNGVYMLSKPV